MFYKVSTVILFLCCTFLLYQNYHLEKKLDHTYTGVIEAHRMLTECMIMMDSMQQMLPDEIETVSRQVAREEGIKLFKEFSENLQNLRKAEE